MQRINIALDGPAGAGKSTVAKRMADKLGYIYIDTGAMYRALTWKALQVQVDVHDEQQLVALLNNCEIRLEPGENGQKVYVDDEDVTNPIREREVTNQVSFVASHEAVRLEMLRLQRELAKERGVVMDGRDIGTHVLPTAEIKIFLSASIQERAERRFLELQQKGEQITLAELEEEIKKRDEIDSQRKTAPLRKAEDAVEIDSTGLSIEQVVQQIVTLVQQKLGGE
ncbi:(d)CMP kinase [Bacillus horti]|uniref:Cytidylate kinase n=1 Tax=Caldalkalibacillus horti TaxID=77523 RepID=A0ABT9W5J9_9BACI|nr:(d)CMP kinase [Bacillus horti]MDQ0168518.1 cytidylate kinase [Bacillus horti]